MVILQLLTKHNYQIIVVLLFCCLVVLLSCCFVVLLFCCFVVWFEENNKNRLITVIRL